MKNYLKLLSAALLLLPALGQNVKSVPTVNELVQLSSYSVSNVGGTSPNALFQTIIVNGGFGAGTYALTNTIANTNTSTRLASVGIPGYSWDQVNSATPSPTPPSVETIVGSRFTPYGGSSFTGTDPTTSYYASSGSERVILPVNCYGVNPVYIGYYQSSSSAPGWTYANGFENPLPNALEIASTVVNSAGQIYPHTFNGARIFRLNPYGIAKVDPNYQQYNAGDYVIEQSYANRLVSNTNTYNNGETGTITAIGTYLPLYGTQIGDAKSGYQTVQGFTALNAKEALIDTVPTIAGNVPFAGQVYMPFAYTGFVKASDLNSVVAVGDSITAGVGDSPDTGNLDSGGGYLYRALRRTNPLINLGIGGDKAQSWAVTNGTSRTTFRTMFLSRYKYKFVYLNMGYNDINAAGRSFAQLTNDYANLAQTVYNLTGAKIIAGTITCGQNTASGKYYGPGDLSPQYPNATNVAPAFNALLRSNPTALSPYIYKVWDQAALWSPDDINARYLTNSLYQGTVTTTNSATFLNVYWRTIIDSGASWTPNQWVGQPVQITNTVAPAYPGNAMVISNTATTLYISYPPGVSVSLVTTNLLSVGATYSIGNGSYTVDGSHPAPWIHGLYGSNIVSQGLFK